MIEKFEKMIETECQAAYDRLFIAIGGFNGSFMAGGCVASLALGEEVNDYDIWFESVEHWTAATSMVKAVQGVKYAYKSSEAEKAAAPIVIIAETEHALTFSLQGVKPVYQLVKSRTGGVGEEVIEAFDYLHAQAGFYPAEGGEAGHLFFGGRNTIEFIREKILVFAGELDYPTHTLSRVAKFARRGYIIPDRTIAQLVRQIREADDDLIIRDLTAVGAKYNGGEHADLKYYGGTKKKENYDPITEQDSAVGFYT